MDRYQTRIKFSVALQYRVAIFPTFSGFPDFHQSMLKIEYTCIITKINHYLHI